MPETWIVFGGWAVKPEILAPLFGPSAVFIDSNPVAPAMMRGTALAPDWRRLAIDCIAPKIPPGTLRIAGWSTGAILAAAVAGFAKPSCAVFISATPSFCRRPGFAFGWKGRVLQAMREELASDRGWVLDKFYMQCGIGDAQAAGTDAELSAGLHFLEQASLLPPAPFPFPSLFLHGNADTVVVPDAGKYFCKEGGGRYKEFDGPHAFFVNQYGIVRKTIESIKS